MDSNFLTIDSSALTIAHDVAKSSAKQLPKQGGAPDDGTRQAARPQGHPVGDQRNNRGGRERRQAGRSC